MDKNLIRKPECKRIIGQCRDDSQDVDSNIIDQLDACGKHDNDSYSCDEGQNIHLQLGTLAIRSERANGRSKFSKPFWASNLIQFVFLVLIGSFHAQGFSSFTIMTDTKGITKLQNGKFCMRNQYNRPCGRRIQRTFSGSVLFSKSPTIEEATISLEWMEYFAPTIENDERQETPVLFLHGLLGSKRNFATCANMLAVQLDKKRRIIGVDLRNHGNTQPWSEESKYKRIFGNKKVLLFSIMCTYH